MGDMEDLYTEIASDLNELASLVRPMFKTPTTLKPGMTAQDIQRFMEEKGPRGQRQVEAFERRQARELAKDVWEETL